MLSDQGAVSVDDKIWGRHDDFRTPDGLLVDIAWWTVDWFESQLRRTVDDCVPLAGYSTVWWHQLLNATPVADPTGWYSALRLRYEVPYPDRLRARIVALSMRAMQKHSFSYVHQLELAAARHDPISLNHRVSAFLASYFDALFALNRVTHPGEKRLIAYALARCTTLPDGFPREVEALLGAKEPTEIVDRARALADTMSALAERLHLA